MLAVMIMLFIGLGSAVTGINKLSWGFIVSLKRHYSILSIVHHVLSHRSTIACSSSAKTRQQTFFCATTNFFSALLAD